MRNNLKKLYIIIGLCALAAPPMLAQNIYYHSPERYNPVFVATDDFGDTYLDTLATAYSKATIDTLKYAILNDLAYYWHTQNLDSAMAFTLKGLRETEIKNDTLWNGRFQITQGAILLRQEKLNNAYRVLEEAKQKVLESDLAFLNTQLGYVFERRGQLDKAADYAMESLRLGNKLNDKKAQALAYSDLSNLFWKQGKFKKGLEFGLKSVALFEERKIKDLDYDFTLYVVGNNYLELKDNENALKYFEKSKTIGEQYGFFNNLSDVYISLTDLYAEMGNYNKAEEAGNNALKFAELLNNNFMIMRSWLSIGKYQNLNSDYNKAIESLKTCIEVATENFGDEYYLSQAYKSLAEAYFGAGKYEASYLAMQQYDTLKDAVFTAAADQRISLLQTEFEVALKEDKIQDQEIQIELQHNRQLMIIVFASVLLFLLLLLYKFYRGNKKKNIILNKQNDEKAFLLKEIHHRVKNNLEVVSGLLSLQSSQLKDKNAISAMQESQNRVQSMSMIHQRLYKGEKLASIEMKGYFLDLGNNILDSYGNKTNISFECNMATIELDVDTAVPLGLIVNELFTNALKYAFPNNTKGTIKIDLKEIQTNDLQLIFEDDGIGSTNKNSENTGFGLQLINLLTKQLNGEMKRSSENGTQLLFHFKMS